MSSRREMLLAWHCVAIVWHERGGNGGALDSHSSSQGNAGRSLHGALASDPTFRSFLESVPDALVIADSHGRIVLVNSETERLFGYLHDELIGQSVESLIAERHWQTDRERLDNLTHLKSRSTGGSELYGRRRDASEFPIEIRSSTLERGPDLLVSSSIRDITERRRADQQIEREIGERRRTEESLARAKVAADAAHRELETFSYSVAHDLRAPLRGISGFAQLLLDTYGGELDEDGKDWLQEIVLNATKMGALIDALLSLARVTRSEPHYERVDLSSVFRACADELASRDPDRVVELVVQPGLKDDLDPVLARVLLENLVSNAWKFTSKVPNARIEFGAKEHNGTRVFFVRDNGAGYDMAFGDKLFGPFQRLHSVDEFPGTGIGLATVQRIIRRHGGSVWGESVLNEGATFNFSLHARAPGAPQ